MLVLNRKPGQSITIGEDIEIKFLKVHRKGNIRVAIKAPQDVSIIRDNAKNKTKK